jgi:hypothetical protein
MQPGLVHFRMNRMAYCRKSANVRFGQSLADVCFAAKSTDKRTSRMGNEVPDIPDQ